LLIALLGAAASRTLSAQSYCVAASDTTAQVLLANSRTLASSPDVPYAEARARGGVPLTAASSVTYVTDERVCQRIAQAIADDAVKAGRRASNRVRVIKIGDVFVAQDPALTFNASPLTYYLTKAYKVTRRIGAF
jgi:hypothetical protein